MTKHPTPPQTWEERFDEEFNVIPRKGHNYGNTVDIDGNIVQDFDQRHPVNLKKLKAFIASEKERSRREGEEAILSSCLEVLRSEMKNNVAFFRPTFQLSDDDLKDIEERLQEFTKKVQALHTPTQHNTPRRIILIWKVSLIYCKKQGTYDTSHTSCRRVVY